MKEYTVNVDVTMTGSCFVEAENEQEAIEKVKGMQFVASDLRNFYHFSTDVLEAYAENDLAVTL